MARINEHSDPAQQSDPGSDSALPEDRERLLSGFERIVVALQSTLDLNEILDTLAEEAIKVGLFKSLSIALVDHDNRQVVVRRRINRYMMEDGGRPFNRDTLTYPLDDFNITAEVAWTDTLTVVDGWDDRFLCLAEPDRKNTDHVYENRSFYFIPVKVRDRVTAVLATGSPRAQRADYLSHISAMQPILDQIALVLHHAYLYEKTQQSADKIEAHQRLGRGMHEIGLTILSSSDLDEALDTLVLQITESGVFRSLMVALVDQDESAVTIVRKLGTRGKQPPFRAAKISRTYDRLSFDEAGLVGEVAVKGNTEIIQGWDDRFDIEAVEPRLRDPANYVNNVTYFIPVKHESRVIAVLATGSTEAQREEMAERIAAMGPLLDQVAIAIQHTRLFQDMEAARTDVEEKSRQLQSFNTIGRVVLDAKDLDTIVETLMLQVGETGLFRSLTFSSVNYVGQTVLLKATMNRATDGAFQVRGAPVGFPDTDLHGPDISAVVARERRRVVIEGWDDRYQTGLPGSPLLDPANYKDKVAYFVPVISDGQTIAVLATASRVAERQATERRLDSMRPLLDLVAVAIGHAQMVKRLSDETERLDTQVEAHERANLGLLRINALIQSITTVEDLEKVIRSIYDECKRFGVQLRGMTIRRVIDKDRQLVEQYAMHPDDRFRRGSGRDSRAIDEWLAGRTLNRRDVENDLEGLPPGYYDRTYSSYGIKVASVLTIPFRQGVIAFRSDVKDAFSEPGIRFIKRIAGVLSVGMSRISDLERIDRGHRFEGTLLGISQLCADIVSTDGLQNLLQEMLPLFDEAGISADGIVLHRRLYADQATYQSWWVGRQKVQSRIAKKKNLQMLSKRRLRYRRDLVSDLEDLSTDYPDIARVRYGTAIRTTLEIPFSQGIMGLVSAQPAAYSEDEIRFIQRTTELLSVGLARISDLESLEKRSREQQALLAVSQAVADMTTSDALPTIMSEVRSQLTQRGVPLVGLALHTLTDSEASTYESIRIRNDCTVTTEQMQSSVWYDHWSSKETTYLADLQHDPHNYPAEFYQNAAKLWGVNVGSILVVPHSRGVMALPCEPPQALKPDDIAFIERIAQIISLGTARLEDLRGLELRAHELAREKDFSNSLVQSMLEGFVVTEAISGKHVEVNPALCKMTGFSRDELIGVANPRPYWPPECLEQILAAGREINAGNFVDFELTFMRKNGERFPVTVTPSATYDGKGNILHYIATIRDVSSRRQLENERIQTQRLRAAGELSAGICHNLNNILTGVVGPAQLLRMQSKDDTVLRHVEAILTSAKRATDIVQQLYQGTTQREQELERVELEQVVNEAIQASSPRWKDEAQARGIRFDIEHVCDASPTIRGTIAQVHDIILNLLFNAIDAQADGGRVLLRTTQTADQAILTVSDNGIGMNEETKARIFEPFFTTKMDVGTGLGLATVYNTMIQWGGSIEVDSEPNKGTTFVLRFPLWQGVETPADPEKKRKSNAESARILVIDDDENVADFVSQALSTEHKVDRARSGKEAFERGDLTTFDVAVIDLGMAEMAGDRVGAKIRETVPGIGTVMISGWDLASSDARLEGFDAYLKKPFANIGDLLSTTQEVVELSRKRRA